VQIDPLEDKGNNYWLHCS